MAKSKMVSKKQSTLQGFTIIEVVLVLAIAGLIFLMVFIALPALQRNQRDTQLREDYSALATAVTNYTTNNNGSLPPDQTSNSKIKATDLNANGLDPRGNAYTVKVVTGTGKCTPTTSDSGTTVCVVKEAKCNGGVPEGVSSKRAFVIYGAIEGSGGTYCQQNT